jgi:hypothetical protein
MNIRERVDAFWSGEQPDRIPYTIYQNEWRHTASAPEWIPLYQKGLGVTWHLPTVKETWPSSIEVIEQSEQKKGQNHERRILKTPVGEISESYIDGWRQKFYLETQQDYEVMTYIVKNTLLERTYDEYHQMDQKIGPYGIPLVMFGRTPLQRILVDLVGLENFSYHLVDLHDELIHLYDVMLDMLREKTVLVAEGPGRFVSVLENFTAESLGPARYKKYLLPVYQELFPILQSAGKIVGTHYDGQLSSCKKWIAEAPIDLIESLTPPPEGDLSLAEARAAWPDKLFWSNINVDLYYRPEQELKEIVRERVAQAAPDGRRLAFEVSEQYPDNWQTSIGIVLDALEEIHF